MLILIKILSLILLSLGSFLIFWALVKMDLGENLGRDKDRQEPKA